MTALKQRSLSSSKLIDIYRDKPVIFLEGETDLKLFRNYWFFNSKDKVDFRVPERGIGSDGVVRSVQDYRKEGIPAFGLVERDKLQADGKWNLVWETNDDIFRQACPYGEHVRVTRYWELESYLINPSILEAYVCHFERGRSPKSDEDAEIECLQHAEALIPHAAMNEAKRKQTPAENEFPDGQTSRFSTRNEVEEEYRRLQKNGELTESVWKEYQEALPRVEKFSVGTTPLAGLLRRINGKAILHRITTRHRLQNDHTFALADNIRVKNAIPQELVEFVNIFCGAGKIKRDNF